MRHYQQGSRGEGTPELPKESILLLIRWALGSEADVFPSVAVRASTLSLDADSLGLALPVAFGCHGSRKNGEKWKHLASRCRNLTVQFSYLDSETAFMTVTGRGRDGDGDLSSFKHLGVDV